MLFSFQFTNYLTETNASMCFRQIMGLLPEKRKRIPTGPSKIDNPEKLATQGTQDEEKQNKNNPEKLATSGTQDEEKQNKNNPEKLATSGTQDEEKQNKNNPEKLATSSTQDEEKQRRRKKPNTKCIGNHYAQGSTNNVNRT